MNAPVNTLVTAQIAQVADVLGLSNIDPQELKDTLIQTAFRTETPATDAQMASLLIVAGQYKLNPWTKEIYAFPDKNKGIIPVVGVDGWSRIINGNSNFNGMEFRFSENMVQMDGAKVEAPEWVECIIYRKDREHPTIVREYLAECYRAPFKSKSGYVVEGPWQSHPSRFLRHKATIQCARLAFGFVGIHDQDEAERIAENQEVKTVSGVTNSTVPEGYQAFEAEHLPHFKNEAQYGTKRLQAAYSALPSNNLKNTFWSNHAASLKEIAQFADQALAREGETYEHSPA
ncbi:phage recombination protein Bet [Acinetobacter sp.]|uniref:phage recombination protein Bet n=1 Tax=Acinetobacter sp. TaxID=472 RepID=UPI0029109C0D|nr:phage recombination protein Bet [Acinetobacter sp.]MDU4032432.1 phage recombination protein Bet [Acinetobacter sp.]